MTGWYVRALLEESARIRAEREDGDEPFTSSEDDLYDDLLSVETTIKTLARERVLSPHEIAILRLLPLQKPIYAIAKILKMHKQTVDILLESACSKVSFCLGDHFTDDGFIAYMIRKYNLKLQDGLIIDSLIHKNYRVNRKVLNVRKQTLYPQA